MTDTIGSKTILLELDNLCLRVGSDPKNSFKTKSLSFKINRGETLGVVGESGSGKSITSLSIMRLIPKNALYVETGQAIWHENETAIDLLSIDDESIRLMRGNKISMIFQEPMTSLNPSIKCGQQVQEAIELHLNLKGHKAKERVLNLFEEVLLPSPERIYNSYPHQLSGGQKQRVMIAMALSTEPDLLIADEPTTALDITVQKSILELLKNIQKRKGLAMIFITHDLAVVNYLSDQIIVMRHGEIVEYGQAKEIISNPQNNYTKGLLACRPPVINRPKRLLTVSDFMENNDGLKTTIESEEERKKKHEAIYQAKPILEVEKLKVWYPINRSVFKKNKTYVKAVNDVSFKLFKGETLGLVGESGCGKSSLGRAILQLNKPTAGSVKFKGQELTNMGSSNLRKLRKEIQIIFQDPYSSLNPKQRVGDAISEPLLWHGIVRTKKDAKERTIELLNKVGLKDQHYDRYAHEFSGGQRQRINIARSISLQPELIVCDESVSALDVSVQSQVLNLLNDLKEEFDLTYIFISHDLSVIKYMSDRVMVMNQGKIEELGEADHIYQAPKSEYTKTLIDAHLSL